MSSAQWQIFILLLNFISFELFLKILADNKIFAYFCEIPVENQEFSGIFSRNDQDVVCLVGSSVTEPRERIL